MSGMTIGTGTYELVAAGLLAAVQVALMVQLARAQRAMQHTGKRLDQLTSALELLTDTSETGFTQVAAELERLGSAPVRRASELRSSPTARVARSGDDASVAAASTDAAVRLHAALDQAAGASAELSGADPDDLLPSDRPRPGDLERWTFTMRRRRTPATGARHAAVRV